MWDFDLQLRFLKSTNDAWVSFATASAAALAEWQDQSLRTLQGSPAPKPQPMPLTPFDWWASFWKNSTSPAAVYANGHADFGSSFFQFAQPQFSWPPRGNNAMPAFNPFMPWWPAAAATPPAWGLDAWPMFKWPMAMMMISQGVPYTVAAPAADASVATWEATEAARQQFSKLFSAYRSEGGHAAAQITAWPVSLMLLFMPWLAPFLPHGF